MRCLLIYAGKRLRFGVIFSPNQSNRVSKRQPMRERVESACKKTKLDHFKRLKSNRFWNCINMVLTPVREYFFFHVSLPQIASQRYQFKDFGLINLKTKYNPMQRVLLSKN